jgi:hypothetical protein
MDVVGVSNSTALSSEDLISDPTSNDYSQDTDAPKKVESDADVFGVKGLFGIISVEQSENSKLALGVDLTSLGLNMNQPEYRLSHLQLT